MEHKFELFKIIPHETTAARWEKWLARFEIHMVARNITSDSRLKAQLIDCAGEEVFDVYSSLQIPLDVTYERLKAQLDGYFAPQRNCEYEKYVFRKEVQAADQKIDSFHTKLRGLSKYCGFENTDCEIKSQIIQNCQDLKVREKGLIDTEITLQQLLVYARSLESVRQQATLMTGKQRDTTEAVISNDSHPEGIEMVESNDTPLCTANRIGRGRTNNQRGQSQYIRARRGGGQNQPSNKTCSYCGNGWHSNGRQHNCPSYSATCSACGIIAHFSRMCHRRQSQNNSTLRSDYNNRNNMVNENQYDFYDEKSHVNDIHTRRAPKPYTCNLILNGVSTQFEIDTGAGRTLLCARDYYKVRNEGYGTVDLESGGVPILRSYSGDTIETIGKVVLNANHNGSSQNITVIVVKSNGPNLLGRDSLNTLQIDWTNVFTMNTSDVNIFAKYPNLFKAELGMLKDVKVKINVEINHSPRFCKARSVP